MADHLELWELFFFICLLLLGNLFCPNRGVQYSLIGHEPLESQRKVRNLGISLTLWHSSSVPLGTPPRHLLINPAFPHTCLVCTLEPLAHLPYPSSFLLYSSTCLSWRCTGEEDDGLPCRGEPVLSQRRPSSCFPSLGPSHELSRCARHFATDFLGCT